MQITSCTDILATWLVPPTKKIKMEKLKTMRFQSQPAVVKFKELPPFSAEDIDNILTNVQKKGEVSAIMSIRLPFSERFHNLVPQLPCTQAVSCHLTPIFFSKWYQPSFENLDLEALKIRIKEIDIQYTPQQVQSVENLTKTQGKCREWYRLRTGRVTASVFKLVCRTSLLSPSISLIKKICYPEMFKLVAASMKYGIDYEDTARKYYDGYMAEKHGDFKVEECGLYIKSKFPHLGASPDGIITCDCCGVGVVEIKCPFSARNDPNLSSYINKKNSPVVNENDNLLICHSHEYFFQIQMQMQLTETFFGDLVIWHPEELVIIRVLRDDQFWAREYPKTVSFFYDVIMPELLAKYYTQKATNSATTCN